MELQLYSSDKAREIADVFHQSVHAIDDSVYSAKQKQAWAPSPVDYQRWAERLNVKKLFIALIDNRVAGFIELDDDGHIDCTYTHPDFQGQGVASALYELVLKESQDRDIRRLYVEASLVAKPFFERRGFNTVKKNLVQRNGVRLVNFSMETYLTPNNKISLPTDSLDD